MSVSIEEVRRIAALARLRFDPDEEERLARELSTILDHMEVLSEVVASHGALDGDGEVGAGRATPYQPAGMEPDPLRRSPAELAPEWREGFFLVPRLPALDGDAFDRDLSDGDAPGEEEALGGGALDRDVVDDGS